MFKEIGDELADFIAWMKDKLADTDVRREIALDLGLQPGESVPEANLPPEKLDSIERYRSQANPDKEAFFILLNDVRAIWEAARAFISALGVSEITALNHTVALLFDTLALNYFRLRHPKLYFIAQLLDALAGDASSASDESDYTIERFFRSLARVIEFLLSPIGYLYQSLWFGVQDEAEARRVSERTFSHLAAFLVIAKSIEAVEQFGTKEVILGWDALIKADPEPGDQKTPKADEIAERMLSFAFVNRDKDKATGKETKTAVDVSLAVVPQSHGASGFFIGVGGGGQVETPLSDTWKLRVEFSSPSSAAFLIQKNLQQEQLSEGWTFAADGPNEARLIFSLTTTPDESGVTYKIPDAEGTRIELGQLAFSMVLAGDKTELKATAKECALVIATKDNDGFIGSLIPDEGVRIPINFGMGYSVAKGFFTEGNIPFLSGRSTQSDSALQRFSFDTVPTEAAAPPLPTLSAGKAPQLGLEQVIPVGKALGPVTIKQVLLGMFPGNDPDAPTVAAEVSTSLVIELGPVLATVDRLGFQFNLGFPQSGGNLGFADLALGLKAPLGVGLKVEAPMVSGGGFLGFDPDRGQYAGAVHLDIEGKFALNALGLIATRLPDNTKGFSLLVIITAEDFKPIPLGLGFTLTGVGGLLAINRTFAEDVLRAGLKNHTLDSVMFPQDVLRNAPQILSTLQNVFPLARGHHLFGPMVRLAWGTPPLITADLGVVLEFGARLRLLILGQITAILPKRDNDLIRLQMDALGVLDFDQGTASLDATLYDSRLLKKFVLTGDMAMRLRWEGSPTFALAIGGLHPAFNPPPNFPKLERIAINLAAGDNPRLRCEAYFALTANTVQFGARAELYAEAAGFSIQGETGFDVLIQFDPFYFMADFYAQVQLKRGSRNLFKVRVEGALAGPRPLHIKGKATFEVLWMDVTLRIDKTLVAGEKPPPPEPVDVLPRLKEALGHPDNWVSHLPDGQRPMVTLRPRQGAANEVALHPLGTLTVKQNVVPLNLDIARFGQTTPAGARRFTISSVSLGGQNLPTQPVRDFFAPAQFFELSDDEKLSRPSFETLTAGVSVGAEAFTFSADADDWLEVEAITFETITVDPQTNVSHPSSPTEGYVLSPELLDKQARFGAAGASDLRRLGKARYRTARVGHRLVKEGWSIVDTADLSVQSAPGMETGKPVAYSEAAEALRHLQQENPARASGLKILRLSELQGATPGRS